MAEQNLQTINVSEEQNQQEVSDIKMAEQNPQTTNAGEEQNQQQEVSTITDTKEPVKMDVCEEQTQQEVSTTTHAKEPKEEDTKQNPEDNVEKVEGRKVTVEDGSEETSVKEHGPDKNANDATTSPNDPVEIVPTKKKKKRKKKKKSGIDELDLHDMGPIEADEDKLYESSKPLTHRIEEAIQRYRKNRKFPPIRNQVFTSYLRFGGISTGQKAFLTQDGAENEDEDAQDIAARRSTDYIEEEDDDVEVDFTYTARVYLSGYLIDKSGYVQMEQFVEAPQVVISFLNYLRNHKVCPEHEDDMQGALQIAQKAAIELPKCKALAHNAPGKFHKACSLLFGGELYGVLDDPWNGEEKVAMMIGISKGEGRRLITKVFGANAFEELKRVEKDTKQTLSCEVVEVVESEQSKGKENSVKNTEVVEPSQSTNGTQSSAEKNSESPKPGNENKQVNNETGNANAENDSEDDAINFKRVILRGRSERDTETFHVNIDSNLAENVLPGMLITADFHRLSNGFWYWDKVTNVYPSYYLECEDDSDDDDY